ncbi:MAG TPA: hypothetical protein VGW12_00250 [Pyrinomonadaceae bacterium]|nr:hypothetical protein [Pyrinomonadaceae bacterium]
MAVAPLPTSRFIRKTQLGANEYRKNFHQIDREIIEALTSAEADRVTPLMSKIYLCLVNAPAKYWERDGVLRIEAEVREGKMIKAWAVLCDLAGVASATANKAMQWMHGQGIIGYFSGKNGVGLRIFLNRAASSIGTRQTQGGKKILTFLPASFDESHTSPSETAFKDSFAVSEILDTDLIPDAPENGADRKQVDETSFTHPVSGACSEMSSGSKSSGTAAATTGAMRRVPLDEIISHLRDEIEPGLMSVAARAATEATRSEFERTRTWFETKALPKAVRVAQSECYGLLKKQSTLDEKASRLRATLDLGRHHDDVPSVTVETAQPRTPPEVNELAEVCLALLETQSQSIEVTLSDMSIDSGGWLLAEDASRVRAAAKRMLAERERRG